ncbi:hypothetical protein [Mycolicibacterium holsaticum]|uniref:hypothetical protein n=1 Tax=Mycolicibacterium holsaticum TaxID=152142 RepID=UPI00366A9696
MGIGRPPDPYGLTTPPAWPEVDEEVLQSCADAFAAVSHSVQAQLDVARKERTRLFAGVGVWSGKSAAFASAALDRRITDLESVTESLDAAAKLFTDSIAAVVHAKSQIISNVEAANKVLDFIQNHPDIPEGAKAAAIDSGVDAIRSENIGIVAAAGTRVSGTPSSMLHEMGPDKGHGGLTQTPVNPVNDSSDQTRFILASNQSTSGTQFAENPLPAALLGTTPTNEAASDITEAEDPPVTEVPFTIPISEATSETSGAEAPPLPPAGGESPSPPPAAPTYPGTPVIPGAPTAPATPSAPRINTPTSPLSGTSAPSPSTPSAPSTANPAAAAANQAQLAEFQRSMADAATKAAGQAPIPPPQPASPPIGTAPAAQPLSALSVPDTPTASTPPAPTSSAGPSPGLTAPAPVAPPSVSGAPPGGAVPLGPPATPPPAAPVAPPSSAAPSVAPAAASAGSGSVGAPAPVPVSAARAQREAIAAATLRRPSATDPAQIAHRIAAALNVGVNDIGFFWITGLAKDGTIVVANNYGLGYIPENVNLPDQVKMATADESIPATVRGTWATYPILALHGWAQHHNTELRAVIATEDQFKGFDPGAPTMVLRPDDIPESGQMTGRHRLQVIAADAAVKLAALSGGGLSDVLPPARVGTEAPDDQRSALWFEVFRPLLSNAPDRGQVQLDAFVTYAEHAQELALHRAHIATEPAEQRAAIADWIYWQHLAVLMADAIATSANV